MFDSRKSAPKDEEEMEDFPDYEDEERSELDSKARRLRRRRRRGRKMSWICRPCPRPIPYRTSTRAGSRGHNRCAKEAGEEGFRPEEGGGEEGANPEGRQENLYSENRPEAPA